MSGPTPRADGLRADVVLVDSDADRRLALECTLAAAGWSVRSFRDGTAAIEAARLSAPDVVIVSVSGGHLQPSAPDLSRALRTDLGGRFVKIVAIVGEGTAGADVGALEAAADDLVRGPVDADQLRDRLRLLMRVRALEEELARDRARPVELGAAADPAGAPTDGAIRSIVHDLKNPLTAIGANLDLLERRVGTEATRLVRRCRSGVKRMNQMILDLLDIVALEERRFVMCVGAVDVEALVRRAVAEASDAAEQRGVVLEASVLGTDCRAQADGSVLRRVVDHLVSHALEQSPRGATVEIEVGRRDRGLEIRVTDRGPGIPEAYRERIFERSARDEVKRAGLSANRGLGLTFCRLAVLAHGGRIDVEAAPEGGSVFRVVLPVARPSEIEAPVSAVV